MVVSFACWFLSSSDIFISSLDYLSIKTCEVFVVIHDSVYDSVWLLAGF